ncbi:hypothetical protein AMECASPLE_026897 [Ameca splendens]|uniref:Uncharacterized protein n=1 Tax=Ameca splendens TaxID=208324 RepID=A0ABV1A164_9TELE
MTHQFRGLYEGDSPALLRLSVFSLRGTSALLLVGDLKKTSDHSLDFGFIPCSGPPWIPLCLVKRNLSTLLDHQEVPTELALPHCPRLATISPLVDCPTRISDGLPGNFAPCTFHKLLINSLNASV